MRLDWISCPCSAAQPYPTLCDPMDCSIPGLPAPHHLLEFAQIHVHCISDAVQPSHPLMPSFPSALNLFQLQRLILMSHLFTSDWIRVDPKSLSWATKSLQLVPVAMKLKDFCSLEEKL